MSRNYRRRPLKKPERRVWVFSELNPDLTPKDIARILASAALEAAEAAKASQATEQEADHD
jgi:hypothetical protein